MIPFLKTKYFSGYYGYVFKEITNYVKKYNSIPTKDAFTIEIAEGLNEENYGPIQTVVDKVFNAEADPPDFKWLLDKTESWCQEQALHNTILASIDVIEGKESQFSKGDLPKLFTDALAVSFDRNIGHDFFEDHDKRFEFYHAKAEKFGFDVDVMNEITGGGFEKKTLNIFMASTGVGKSLWMCHFAAYDLTVGRNVLYITNEMAEEKIAKRIDANLLDTDMGDIDNMTKKEYTDKLGALKARTEGKLIVKEYPTASSNVNHYRALLEELRIKKRFVPDVIYVDYLNIMASSRVRMGGAVSTYVLVKSIAEELRGLAIEYQIPIVSATQTNRDGYNNSDIGLDNTSESFGLPQTVDFMLGIMQTEELRKLGHFACKQLKNRYDDLGKKERFHVGVDKGKMRLYDVGDIDDTPVFDETNAGEAMEQFEGFVV